ncbi:aliphatic sulfonate ABC transporter substrate-binding protein [Peribacillus cavernae]|uniref:Putative aliphatic sulfonates-binding protein n=1 Tax=Peribacillus cavernae TaxID=1674310 RepID=A0A3S0VXX9_9BACI|nr:aliphatic sulfonate ABC transporter substrate-binding protein [Peribacillus cavernae]MDQ0219240.1 sulfonate transport system substrate-binding protein [Peribacillus cavernae]RUQ28547.1 aliphatic sulfonate ABC transporter substrate-binding protein [Peribacillus cavernae]
MHNANRRWKLSILLSLLFLIQVTLTACGPSVSSSENSSGKSNGKVIINIGVQGSTGILPYAREKKYFEKAFEKVGVEVKWHEFTSGPPHFEALASGRLDFGATGGTPLIAGQSGGVDFKAIAVTKDGKKDNSFVIPKNSNIKGLKGLKGKKIAVAKGSSAYNFLYMAIEKAGLKEEDIKIVQLQPDEARPALDNGSVDAWSTWEPYTTAAVYQTGAKILVNGEDLNINAPGFLVGRTDFITENPKYTILFLKTYEQVRRHLVENLDEVSQEIATSEKVDVEIIRTVLKNSQFILSPTTDEFKKAHQEQANFLYSVEGINKKLDTSKVIENQYIEQALQEIEKEE